jgi:hypothetical protein
MQSDPMHPAFKPRPPRWLWLVGVLILLGLVIYLLVG